LVHDLDQFSRATMFRSLEQLGQHATCRSARPERSFGLGQRLAVRQASAAGEG
jgi:hypothetical protein